VPPIVSTTEFWKLLVVVPDVEIFVFVVVSEVVVVRLVLVAVVALSCTVVQP
jgi:hypothetical protein